MNGENINNGAENRELGVNKELQKELGGVTLENYDLMSQEELDKSAEEAEKTRKALLEQWIKINATAKKIEEEKAKREEYNRQKEAAARGGIMKLTGWVNKHPEDLKEFVHPELQSGVEKALKEHVENGKSFFNILYASRELTARLAEVEAAQKAADAILAEYAADNAEAATTVNTEVATTTNTEVSPVNTGTTTDIRVGEDTISANDEEDDYEYDIDDDDLNYDIVDLGDGEYDIDDSEEGNDKESSEEKDGLSYDLEDDDEVELDDSKEAYEGAQDEIDKILDEAREELSNRIAEFASENTESLDEEAEKIKDKKIDSIKKKYGLKYKFKRMMISAAAIALTLLTVAGCAKRLIGSNSASANSTSENKAATEEMAEMPSRNVELGTGSKAAGSENITSYEEAIGKQAERPSYQSTFNFVDANGETKDYALEFGREVQEDAPDLFDVPVREKGESQTTNNKETKGAFSPIFDASELEGSTNVLSYLSAKGDMMAQDPLYMFYANSWNGALDASDGYGIDIEHVSVDGINEAAQKFKDATPEEKQRILDKIMADEAEVSDGVTYQYATFPANRTYITAHMEKGDDGVKRIDVDKSSKPEEFNVLQRLNADGENEYNQGETKLRILKAHGLVNADAELGSKEADAAMKRYTVWGERNKCGGQMVITEKVAKRKTVNPEQKQNPQPVIIENTYQQIIPVGGGGPNPGGGSETPTPNNPTPDNPTPELKGKTMTNPWAGNNPTQMPITESFEQESENNGGARIVQAGQEQIPEINTSGVNTAAAAQQDWAEQPTAPVEDTGAGGTVDQSASSDAGAAAMLAAAESGSSSSSSSETSSNSGSGSSESSSSESGGSNSESSGGGSESSTSESESQ